MFHNWEIVEEDLLFFHKEISVFTCSWVGRNKNGIAVRMALL